MYLPAAFREDRLDVLHAAIRDAGLAMLVTAGGADGAVDGPEVTHLPLFLESAEGPHGTLYGHFARANDHWRHAADGPALAVFTGPDAYVSPLLYPSKAEHGRVVPTWNYVAIHARGRVRLIHDPAELHTVVARLTGLHEAGRAAPWQVTDAPDAFVASQLRAIVGFALPIDTVVGKWKMSQNRPAADRAGVAEGLADPVVAALVASARVQRP